VNLLEEHLHSVVNKCWNYAKRLTSWDEHVANAVMGLGGEVGEIVDLHKKFFYHTEKPYEEFRQKLVHELGDLNFYQAKLMELHGITLEEVLEANRAKLESRHPELNKVTERFTAGYIK